MSSRKLFIFFILFLICSGFIYKENRDPVYMAKWVVMKGGSLRVKGSTNINKFTCEIKDYSKPDTIVVYKSKGDKDVLPLNGDLNLDIRGFDCFNPVMTADLRKTLKAKEYPNLVIRFLTLSKFPLPGQKQDIIKGLVDIELSGVKRRFEVNYKFTADERQTMRMVGERDISFSDFKLVPPRKLGGMIQTDDKLSVEFQLILKTQN